jgi:hypothetical protein
LRDERTRLRQRLAAAFVAGRAGGDARESRARELRALAADPGLREWL